MAQTQQSKPKLRLFRIRNLFYCCNIVLYYHKCNIFDNIKNIITILDALNLTHSLPWKIITRGYKPMNKVCKKMPNICYQVWLKDIGTLECILQRYFLFQTFFSSFPNQNIFISLVFFITINSFCWFDCLKLVAYFFFEQFSVLSTMSDKGMKKEKARNKLVSVYIGWLSIPNYSRVPNKRPGHLSLMGFYLPLK